MKYIVSRYCGFCSGVKRAVAAAFENAGENTVTYGELIHNDIVVKSLAEKGVKIVHTAEECAGKKVIVRSHGAGKDFFERAKSLGAEIIDATCPYVRKIQQLVERHYRDGFHIVIIGKKGHPEVEGVNGWCENSATVIDSEDLPQSLHDYEKLCFVTQTTFLAEKYFNILKKIRKEHYKTLEIFNTICYTTISRQKDAENISRMCTKVLVIGSGGSSNTRRLTEIVGKESEVFLVECLDDLYKIKFSAEDTVGIISGASAPEELITEVKQYMSQELGAVKVSDDFAKAVEDSFVSYKVGKRIKGTVISADEKGIKVSIGGKNDGFIRKEDVNIDGSYDPEQFTQGMELDTKIISTNDPDTGCVLLSKKEVDEIKEADKIVETIRNGESFEITVDKPVKGGLLAKLGTYSVFIPASQIRERFVSDLKAYAGKKLAVSALEIDDAKHKIVASHKKIVEAERAAKEEIFWTHVVPNVVVSGVVKRITSFGAFVSVDGFDCLAHIVDLSWNHIKSVDEVLTVGQTYEFLVLAADREKKRVSLGYKQLQPHPFVACMEKHPIGSTLKGKVVSVVPFGVFVEVEPHIEGLVHVSEVAHSYVKDINDVVKVGDEVEVQVLNYDEANKKINLSMKACIPEEPKPAKQESGDSEKKVRKAKAKKVETDEEVEWNEETANNQFADLLKDLNIKE